MKNSVLEGAANSACYQSKSNSPSGPTKGPKGHTGTKVKQVVISNTNRASKGKGKY